MIFDLGARHILQELQDEVQQEAARQGRRALVIAETDQNDPRLVLPAERGGHGLDGVWSDDFHHAVHALLTGEREGYYAAFGDAEHVVKAYNRVFVRDGNWDPFRRRRHGASAGDLPRRQFVVCVQNHDQIGNRAQGERLATLLPPAAQRLAAGLLLLSPCVPLLFMGEEYGESRPFLFFCSYGNPALQRAVRRGRRRELAERSLEGHDKILDPCAEKTFLASQLQWAWPDGSLAGGMRRLYQDLLAARRQWPALAAGSPTRATLVDAPAGTDRPGVIELRRGADDALIAWANCTPQAVACPARRPPDKVPWLSTADRRYGGTRELNEAPGHLEAYELLILGPSGGPR